MPFSHGVASWAACSLAIDSPIEQVAIDLLNGVQVTNFDMRGRDDIYGDRQGPSVAVPRDADGLPRGRGIPLPSTHTTTSRTNSA